MNVLLLVIDSLRAKSLAGFGGGDRAARTPFLDRLSRESMCFRRAYATECWTLPTHASMFTGLLPSEHGAHFQSMAYRDEAPTIAELLAAAGFETEIVTRNPIFDGTIPGILRGFGKRTTILSEKSPWGPVPLLFALTKPRFRRQFAATGFVHPLQKSSAQFLENFVRALLPADERTLEYLLDRMKNYRAERRPYFIFSNLYDVHVPYPPRRDSIMRPCDSLSSLAENLRIPFVLPHLGSHAYLREGFRLSEANREMLRSRYHRAIEIMDEKLEEFFRVADAAGLLDDTIVILTSDHGEAFGEHGLYLHDASVYDTHLHVPLWVRHPDRTPEAIDDVVSTRDLFGLIRAAGLDAPPAETILDPGYRAAHPVALAEHIYYPHARGAAERYRQNLTAAIRGDRKVIVRREGVDLYDLGNDPEEARPARVQMGTSQHSSVTRTKVTWGTILEASGGCSLFGQPRGGSGRSRLSMGAGRA